MKQLDTPKEDFDYIIPVNESSVRYSSDKQLLKITIATKKDGESIFFYKNISPELFGRVCSYFGIGSNNLDIFRMIERLDLMGTYKPFRRGVPIDQQPNIDLNSTEA